MIIIPAIDIKNGNVVRLTQGHFDKEKIYAEDPLSVAKLWKAQGAKLIHIVDLDGAKDGEPRNLATAKKIQSEVGIPVQLGGGIRTMDIVNEVALSGLSRIVLGTRAVEDKGFLKDALHAYGEKIAVSLDCVNGQIATKGWTKVCDIKALDIIPQLESFGLKTLIVTDIATDGMLQGPNLTYLNEILRTTTMNVIASGGISKLADIETLRDIPAKNLYGVIVGKALYEQKFNLSDAIKLC